MKRTTSFILTIAAGVLLSSLTACSKQKQKQKKDDEVVTVEENDPEMVAAIAKARSTLPQFWRAFDEPTTGESDFCLKVKITDSHGTEHFWVGEIERKNGKTLGTINNDPNIVASVKLGQRIEIPEADISDWLYMRNGKMVGNRTMVPLLKTMPPEDAERYRNMMADP